MSLKGAILHGTNRLLRAGGYELVHRGQVYEWQRLDRPAFVGKHGDWALPQDAVEYLRADHPRLEDLRTRYAAFDAAVTTPLVWTAGYVSKRDLQFFRGDNAYVWQVRDPRMNIACYALTTYYLRSVETLGLLDTLEEDVAFGAFCFTIAQKRVSRDLLDSIGEIEFLERHLRISTLPDLRVLDIGAGYGRLAHRMVRALPNVQKYFCTDAVPASTFISDYYLRYRGLSGRAAAIPIDEIERTLAQSPVSLAVNIHSFSECKPAAIEWWLSLLSRHKVRYLLIVPNALETEGDRLLTNNGHDFQPMSRDTGIG